MERHRPTRRRFVRRSGAALSTAGLTVVAGCSDGGAPDETPTTASSASTGTVTPEPDAWTGPEYGRWLPAPSVAPSGGAYHFWALDLTEFDDHKGSLNPDTRAAIESVWPPLDFDWRTVPLVVMTPGTHVIGTDFDREAVVERVAGTTGWSGPTDHEGYDVLTDEDDSEAIAVGDDAIVAVGRRYEGATAPEAARTFVDARRGGVPRYPAESAGLDALMDEFDDGFLDHWRPVEAFDETPDEEPEFDGQVAIGRWGRYVDGPTARVKYVVVYEDPSSADVTDVRRYVADHDDEGELFGPWEDLEVTRRGRLVVVSGRLTRQPRTGTTTAATWAAASP